VRYAVVESGLSMGDAATLLRVGFNIKTPPDNNNRPRRKLVESGRENIFFDAPKDISFLLMVPFPQF
jgi:hypothetical protein